MIDSNQGPYVSAGGNSAIGGAPADTPLEDQLITPTEVIYRPKVGAKYTWMLLLGLFGVYIALVTPIAISLAIRIKILSPAHEEYLGYVIGTAAALSLFSGPIAGVLSDRTRSRFGRRRPWLLAGAIFGTLGLFVIAIAPNVLLVGVGWIITTLGLNTVIGNFTNSQADRLPESERGRVGGLVGFITMLAPVAGVVIGGTLSANSILLFMVPALIGLVLVALFVFVIKEDDSRSRTFETPLSVRFVLTKFLYNPRQYPDFSWNWLARFLFYFGLMLNSTFSAYFFAQRLGISVASIGTTVAAIGGLGVLAVIIGSIGGGILSDKLHRRKVFVIAGGLVFAAGAVIMATSSTPILLFAGSIISQLGLGIFSAVDQALVLDVLPEKETDAGRFVGITGLANSIAQSAAPLIAPLLLGLGGASAAGQKDYSILYFIAAGLTVAGGLLVLKVRAVR
jgi:MFS family permease